MIDRNPSFKRILDSLPTLSKAETSLKAAWWETPLGALIAISDDENLYQLDFLDRFGLKEDLARLCLRSKTEIAPGDSAPITSIQNELQEYFKGNRKEFQTPFCARGTPFQKRVWEALVAIPFGKTCSYSELAAAIGKPTAYRAAAQANGANRFAVIVPCHRVINANGDLGGYDWGLERKKWLLAHEKKFN